MGKDTKIILYLEVLIKKSTFAILYGRQNILHLPISKQRFVVTLHLTYSNAFGRSLAKYSVSF